MTIDSLLIAIHRELQRRFRASGPGTIGRVEQSLNLSSGYFRDQRRTDRLRIDLRVLLKTLELLEIDRAEFFSSILGKRDPLVSFCSEGRFLRSQCRRSIPILEAMRQRLETHPSSTRRFDLGALDAQRDHDPKQLARQAKTWMLQVDDDQIIPLLGIYASACRALGQLNRAQIVLTAAIESAPDGPADLLGDLLLRSSSVLGDQGRYEQAQELAEKAINYFVLADDRLGIAKALIKRGMAQGCAGQQKDEIQSFTAALRYLADLNGGLPRSPSEPEGGCEVQRNLFSALTNLALAHHQLQEFEPAEYLAQRAEEVASHLGPALSGKLVWLRGTIAWRAGRLPQAEAHLERALEFHRPRAPLSSALIAVDLISVQLQRGNHEEATQTTRAMTTLVRSLEPHPVALAAITQLIRCALEGKGLVAAVEDAARHLRSCNDLNPAHQKVWNRSSGSATRVSVGPKT